MKSRIKPKDSDNNITSEDIARMQLDNLDVRELFELSRQVTEKYLDEGNELYKYFHKKLVVEGEDEET